MNADGCTIGFRCVQCGLPIDTLYIQYSPGNIRLMKCEYCKAVADEYIECEVMILIIDLILHKPKAYRHLFYNRFSKETVNFKGLLWKSILAFLILDIYRMWVSRMEENEWTFPVTVVSFLLDFGKISPKNTFHPFIPMAVPQTRNIGINLLRLNGIPIIEQLHLEERLLTTTSENWCLIQDGTTHPTIVHHGCHRI